MSGPGKVYPLKGSQRDAVHPEDSVWLSASAGTGKTQVLSARVLRLLLQPGVDPSQVLCLPFTKAGAAEMAVRINEVLASNSGAFVHSNTTPDAVELHNASATTVNLEGMRITDDPNDPDKFTFGPSASIAPGGYLVLLADLDNTPGIHLDFTLSAEGETLYLYDSVERGGALLDTVLAERPEEVWRAVEKAYTKIRNR